MRALARSFGLCLALALIAATCIAAWAALWRLAFAAGGAVIGGGV